MSLNNPHKTKKSTRVGLCNIAESKPDQPNRTAVAKRRFHAKTGGLGYLAACDHLGESTSHSMFNALKNMQ